jgi:NAD(P)-dependent dehydrogenase (short-subunit alcohol dehydrogenase family)
VVWKEVSDQFRLDGKVALVTGIGPGIGEHVARAFAAAGAKVVVSARTASRVETLAAAIQSEGGEALAVPADVSKCADLEHLVSAAVVAYGQVDVVFGNAPGSSGMGMDMDPLGLTDEDWQHSVDVNLLAPYRLARALVPSMRLNGGGVFINVLSTAGFTPIPGLAAAAYGSTKAGLQMLTRYLAKECGPEIRANAICPGTIDAAGEMRDVWRETVGGVPLRRVGRASEVVGAALLLASPAGSYITGQTIFVDGGRVNTVS